MTRSTARAISVTCDRAFPVLCRLLAIAGGVTFAIAAVRLMAELGGARW